MRRKNIKPGAETGAVADCVRQLLERHGVPEGQWSTTVAEVLGFSRHHGLRKLSAESALTVPELAQLAHHYGETLGQLLMPLVLDDQEIPVRNDLLRELIPRLPEGANQQALRDLLATLLQQTTEAAVMLVDEKSVACRVVLGDTVTPPFKCVFVAIGAPGNWVVLPASQAAVPGREVQQVFVGAPKTDAA